MAPSGVPACRPCLVETIETMHHAASGSAAATEQIEPQGSAYQVGASTAQAGEKPNTVEAGPSKSCRYLKTSPVTTP